MASPPSSPPNAGPTNPWVRNHTAASAALAGDWPPLKVHQIPAAGVEAIIGAEPGADGAEPDISVPVEPIPPPVPAAVEPAAPSSFSGPHPPPSPLRNHSPNPNRRAGRNHHHHHQNHKRNYHQGNIHPNHYPPWNHNPNPNVGYHRLPHPLPMWTPPPPGPQQWVPHPPMVPGSVSPPPAPFFQNGQFGVYTDGTYVQNYMVPVAHTYAPMGSPHMQGPLRLPPTPQTAYVQLMQDIRNQIEFYFSVKNLETDVYLKSRMDKEFGWVDLEVIATFRRVAKLTNDLETIRMSLISSEVVQVENFKVRRRNDWRRWIAEEQRKRAG